MSPDTLVSDITVQQMSEASPGARPEYQTQSLTQFGVADQYQQQSQMQQMSPLPLSPALSPSSSIEPKPTTQDIDEKSMNRGMLQKLRKDAKDQEFWCSISYYEFNERVGEIWHASKDMTTVIIDGFTQPNDGHGQGNRFSLGLLTNINRKLESDSSRRYIGKGCCIYSEKGTESVYLQNQSESSIFVQSPICNLTHSWHPATVVKIPTGCSIQIFSNEKYEETLCSKIRSGYEETYYFTYVCKIRISFVKGWGAKYRRQTVTACPCWVELRLNKPLGILDAALKELTPRDNMSSMT